MGRRGTKPTPIEVLKLTGSKSAYKRDGEAERLDGDPEPPEWLSERGREQWDRMVDRMRGMQFLSPSWRESLSQFCDAWAEYEGLVLESSGAPFLVDGSQGQPVPNPVYKMKAQAWDRVLKMGREFGYTPASKADVRVERKAQDTSKKRFFKGA